MPENNPQSLIATTAGDASATCADLHALRHNAGLTTCSEMAWIEVTGEDRTRWLNGMVSNSIQQLAPGDGCYTFLLSAQGRIQGDAYAFAEPHRILLRTDRPQVEKLVPLLDRFIIMDDVELKPLPAGWTGLRLAGPEAHAFLARIGLQAEVPAPGLAQQVWREAAVTVVRLDGPLVPHFELWAEAPVTDQLAAALTDAGVDPVSDASLEQLRILEGTPRYGIDIRDRELPQETGQTHALHFAKGCYLGQEIVERIRSRGAVHRIFTGLWLDGDLPTSDLLLYAEGKKAGELTSFAEICLEAGPAGTSRLALGYVLREMLDKGLSLTYNGGSALPVPLPFPPAAGKHPSS